MEETLGKRISAGRKQLGMTQDKLAEALGVTAQAVSKWENDQSCPDITMLPKLASLFGTSVDALLGVATTEPKTVHEAEIIENPGSQKEKEGSWEFHWDGGRKPRVLFAVWVLLMGLMMLYCYFRSPTSLNFWNLAWPSALLLFGLSGMYPNFSFLRLGCALFGGYSLLENLQITFLGLSPQVLLIFALLLFGGSLLVDALRKPAKPHIRVSGRSKKFNRELTFTEDSFVSSVSFGEDTHKIDLSCLRQGEINTSFGELKVDLSGVEKLAPDCCINANCSFGELTLRVPRRFRVDLDRNASFASVDLEGHCNPDAVETLYLTADASFGEIAVVYI